MLRALLLPGDEAFITPIVGHASWDQEALAEACPELASQLHAVMNPAAGLERLHSRDTKADSEAPQPLPVIAGSLYLLGDVLRLLAAEQT